MIVLSFFLVLSVVHGEDRRVRYVQKEYDIVEGIVHLDDLVNFVQPISNQDYKITPSGSEVGDAAETRRSDQSETPDKQDVQNAPEQIIQITQEIPVPYPVRIEKKVHYPVPIPVEQPVPVHVPRPYPVRVEKKVHVPVAVPVAQPFPIQKTVPVPYEVSVDNPVPYLVYKPVPFYIQKNVPQPIIKHVPLKVEVPVGITKEVQVPVQVDKKVPLYIPKPVPYEVKIPIEKIYNMEIPVPYPVTIENQTTSSKNVQITMAQLINGARYLFGKSAELPVDMSGGRFRSSQQDSYNYQQ